ncbi:hypothetical protein EON78_04785 [bacterium]|nr:MAG: hypothetical protein EON78_04785 [bacterium]
MSKLASRLHQDYTEKDPSVEIYYKDTHQFGAEMKFSGDMLLLSMHSNIFNFEEGHRIYSSKYVKANPDLSYCGVIYIHNFLADSIRYNRLGDEGTLIARILVNKEKHFIVEGEGQLGFLYEAFSETGLALSFLLFLSFLSLSPLALSFNSDTFSFIIGEFLVLNCCKLKPQSTISCQLLYSDI